MPMKLEEIPSHIRITNQKNFYSTVINQYAANKELCLLNVGDFEKVETDKLPVEELKVFFDGS